MQRPSERQIKVFGVVEQCRRYNIGAIFNLQEHGEHPYCGDGVLPSGFSYKPETFMSRDSEYAMDRTVRLF